VTGGNFSFLQMRKKKEKRKGDIIPQLDRKTPQEKRIEPAKPNTPLITKKRGEKKKLRAS